MVHIGPESYISMVPGIFRDVIERCGVSPEALQTIGAACRGSSDGRADDFTIWSRAG
jgi:hypothetical protein